MTFTNGAIGFSVFYCLVRFISHADDICKIITMMMSLFKPKQTFKIILASADNPRQTDDAILRPEKSKHLRRIRSRRLCITAKSPDRNHLCAKCQAKCFKCKYGSSGTPSHFRPILHFAVCFHGFMQISRSLSQRLLSFSLKWMISMYGGKCV